MILITGKATLHPEHRVRALEAAQAMCASSLAEPGCVDYRFWIESDHPNSILLLEQWADQPSLDAHLTQPSLGEFAAVLGAAIDGSFELTKFEIASSGPLR
jgi:quinol monooxygenase YgiN